MTLITVPLAVIPFSPFVSSIGLLTQTGDYTRRSFIYGSVICLLVALVPALTRLFCSIPLPVSSAVMLVSYLPLLFPRWCLASNNLYRSQYLSTRIAVICRHIFNGITACVSARPSINAASSAQ